MPAEPEQQAIPRLGARIILALFLLAFALRLTAACARGIDRPRFPDWLGFVASAQKLVRTGTYPSGGTFFRAPGYPFFLVVATLGHPGSIALDKIASAAAGGFVAPLLALLSARLFRRRTLAIATGIAGAVHPAFLLFSSDIESEALFIPLLLAAGALLLAAVDRPSAALALLAGLAFAAAALTRPAALALAPLLAAPLWDRRWTARARLQLAVGAMLGFALGLAPWTIRNSIRFGEFIPISDEGGSTFFDGNSDWGNRFYDLTDSREVQPMIFAIHRDKIRRLRAIGAGPGTPTFRSPSKRSLALVRLALEDRRRDPAGTVKLYARKIWHWVRPYPTLFLGAPIVVSFGLLYSALFVAAGVGLATAQRRGAVWFCVAVLLLGMAVHLVFLVLWRYRVPFCDPILLLYAAPGAARLLGVRALL